MTDPTRRHIQAIDGRRWRGVDVRAYKADDGRFREVSRQVLVDDPEDLGCELRYFRVGPNGYTTLERHAHVHTVFVVHGRGRALVGDRVFEIAPRDVVRVPSSDWHQFRCGPDEDLGFLCIVRSERDRAVPATREDVEALSRTDPVLAEFLDPDL